MPGLQIWYLHLSFPLSSRYSGEHVAFPFNDNRSNCAYSQESHYNNYSFSLPFFSWFLHSDWHLMIFFQMYKMFLWLSDAYLNYSYSSAHDWQSTISNFFLYLQASAPSTRGTCSNVYTHTQSYPCILIKYIVYLCWNFLPQIRTKNIIIRWIRKY